MLGAREGHPYQVHLSVEVDGQIARPLTPEVTVFIYDHVGAPLSSLTGTYGSYVTIPADINTIQGTRRFEKRMVYWSIETANGVVEFRDHYRIQPNLNFTTSAEDVRNFVGLTETELPDSAIDLTTCYYLVERDVGATLLSAALISGDISEVWANQAIMLRTAIEIVPSVIHRLQQMQADGVLQVRKNLVRDVTPMLEEAKARYAQLLVDLVPNQIVSLPTVFIVSSDVDVITG